MKYGDLFYGIFLLAVAFSAYKLHIYWINIIKANKEAHFMPIIYIRTVAHWLFIIGLIITSIFYLFNL